MPLPLLRPLFLLPLPVLWSPPPELTSFIGPPPRSMNNLILAELRKGNFKTDSALSKMIRKHGVQQNRKVVLPSVRYVSELDSASSYKKHMIVSRDGPCQKNGNHLRVRNPAHLNWLLKHVTLRLIKVSLLQPACRD